MSLHSPVDKMAVSRASCKLISCSDIRGEKVVIDLPHGETVSIGRGPQTRITDKKCSREQLHIIADCEKQEVRVVQKGANPSKVGGRLLQTNQETLLGPSGVVDVIPEVYRFAIYFGSSEGDSQGKIEKDDEEPHSKRRKVAALNEKPIDGRPGVEDLDQEKLQAEKALPGGITTHEVDTVHSPSRASVKGKRKIQTTLTGFNSTSDKPGKVNKSCDSHMTGCWQWVNTVKIYKYGSEALREKIAMFDLDYTLISTQSGRKFSRDETDWKWLLPQIPSKLHELWATEGYSIIIISNQAALSKKPKEEQEFTKKCELISPQLSIPHRVYAATDKDKYRKPLTGMWDLLLDEGRRGGVDIKRENCLYVGDAAGRSDGWAPGKKKDFSCSDRKFAANLQVAFFTPEEFFLKQKAAKFSWGDFDPREVLKSPSTLVDPPNASITSNKKEIVVFVGFPASGKSTFFKEYMSKSYGYASRDVLKTWQNCVTTSENCITKEGQSVVIDNTNPDVASRERYITLAKKLNVPVRCFYFTTTLAHSRHNNVYRELTTTDPDYKKVPELAFNMYKSKFVEPTLSEGFDEVVRINFIPLLKTEKEKELYAKFLS